MAKTKDPVGDFNFGANAKPRGRKGTAPKSKGRKTSGKRKGHGFGGGS